jgi:hypothetical protein
MQGRPFQGVKRRDFVDALVELTLPARRAAADDEAEQ